jgi:hypothetical protein
LAASGEDDPRKEKYALFWARAFSADPTNKILGHRQKNASGFEGLLTQAASQPFPTLFGKNKEKQ